MHFGFMNVILIHSDHRNVSATHVTICSVFSARIQIYLYCVGITPQLKLYGFA
jgi:hypothetical protein